MFHLPNSSSELPKRLTRIRPRSGLSLVPLICTNALSVPHRAKARAGRPQHPAGKGESVLWQARLPKSLFEPAEKFVLDRKGRQAIDADARQQFTELADAPFGLLVS
jgi:hypothetical protein